MNTLEESLRHEIEELRRQLVETQTELRKAEHSVSKAEYAKTQFLNSMSHELRTPMNAIVGMSELLQETSLSEEQQEFVDIFQSNAEALLELINAMFDLSEAQSGKIILEQVDFDLLQLVESTCGLMAARAHRKGLDLSYSLDPSYPSFLVGDPSRLRQVLVNLIDNAIKFTEQGEIFVKCDFLAESDGKIEWRFSISDTGQGIPQHKRDAIFKSFTKGDDSSLREHGGPGIGLTIASDLVRLMQGRLDVQSREGTGSTFSFNASFMRQRHASPPSRSYPQELKGLKVLIVDDNATRRSILKKILLRWGAQVFEARNAEECLLELRKAGRNNTPFRLLLLDREMPPLDNLQLIEHVNNDALIPDVPTIMLSAKEHYGHLEHDTGSDISAYLVKPVKRFELLRMIGAVLEGPADDKPGVEHGALLSVQRILLVEDYKHNQLLISKYLQHRIDTLDVAENGVQALEMFQQKHYDLILMDMQMPVMDGYSATRKIRELEKERDLPRIPIIALTAHVHKEAVEQSLQAGCDAHLSKPVKKSTLLECLTQYASLPQQEHSSAHADSPTRNENDSTSSKEIVYIDPDFADFIPEFIRDVHQDIQVMTNALDEDDYDTIRQISHKLKGVGGGYGLDEISESARKIEAGAKQEHHDSTRQELDSLLQYLEHIQIVTRTREDGIHIIL